MKDVIIEIIKKLPWSATFLIAAYFLFKHTDQEIAAWVCITVAIIALFIVIKFEYYEKIINRQEKQIAKYSKHAFDSQSSAVETLNKVTNTIASKYKKESDNVTETS